MVDADSVLGNEDLLRNVLSKVPAIDFASTACVSKSWNKVCNRILSRPKLATALSLNSDIHVALQEVMDKVLSEPIRPQFAIAFVGLNYNLADTHQLITQKLGSQIPIITNAAADGMIGIDATTNLIREAKWELLEGDHLPNNFGGLCNLVSLINYCGIVLVVGCLPGLKVETIPLLRSEKDGISSLQVPKTEMIDKFLMDIKEYTATVSHSTSPDAIIMFGDQCVDLKPVLVRMDDNMPKETVIVGDANGRLLFESQYNSRNYPEDSVNAVALVFAKEKSPNVGGKIRFTVTLSNGLVPFGPRLKVAGAVIVEENSTWLTAKMEGHPGLFDTGRLCREVRAKNRDSNFSFYIGVTHGKGCSSEAQRSYLAYYEVLKEAELNIIVDGVGIKPGDSFVFYHTDNEMAFSSMINAYDNLRILKTPTASTSHSGIINCVHNKNEVFGGLIFSCCSRGDSFRGFRINESFPFTTNYPGTPVAGLFCTAEVARVSTNLISLDKENGKEGEGDNSTSGACFLHYYSTVYLVMSYNPYC